MDTSIQRSEDTFEDRGTVLATQHSLVWQALSKDRTGGRA